MMPTTVAEMYEAAGFMLHKTPKDNGLDLLGIDFAAIPGQVISQIQAAPLRGQIQVTDDYHVREKILRCDSLAFNPKSTLNWHMPPNLDPTDFVAIATRRLVINFPNPAGVVANLILTPPVVQSQLNGAPGTQGQTGSSSGSDDGSRGGQGSTGNTGGRGGTYNFPAVFIFYQEIAINIPNPAGAIGLKINGIGIFGGNGGRGGKGGTGGNGARGTSGERNCVLGICACSAGPGRGGDGGPGGPGGRGGDAGRGGNGASIFFVGPSGEMPKLDRTEILLTQGKPGAAGSAGDVGSGGGEGGGGSKPFECKDGGGSGQPGRPATTTDGPGTPNVEGMEGAVFASNRNNSDLF